MADDVNDRIAALEKAILSLGEVVMHLTDRPGLDSIQTQMEEQRRRMEEVRARTEQHGRRTAELREQLAAALQGLPRSTPSS
jgi:uncharacterized membrane-anchored protein YhcB (DUF1043 family)